MCVCRDRLLFDLELELDDIGFETPSLRDLFELNEDEVFSLGDLMTGDELLEDLKEGLGVTDKGWPSEKERETETRSLWVSLSLSSTEKLFLGGRAIEDVECRPCKESAELDCRGTELSRIRDDGMLSVARLLEVCRRFGEGAREDVEEEGEGEDLENSMD